MDEYRKRHIGRISDEGAVLARALISTRLTYAAADQMPSAALLSSVLSQSDALDVMAYALIHAADWAAAILARHAAVTGTPVDTLFQGISLHLNHPDTPPGTEL